MAETYPWKPLFWERVLAVDRNIRGIRDPLATAQAQLALPVRTADAEGGRARIKLAEDKLDIASRTLGPALSSMGAAQLIAHYRGGLIQAVRQPCNRRLGDDDSADQRALTNLRAAKALAEDAYDAIERCRGHLGAAALLLGHPGVPGVDDHIDAERLAAVGDLEDALQQALDIDSLTSAARGAGPRTERTMFA